jgi:hypothetical protein
VRNTRVIIIRGVIALNKGSRGNRISRGISKDRDRKKDNIRGKA